MAFYSQRTSNPIDCLAILIRNFDLCDAYTQKFVESISKKSDRDLFLLKDKQHNFLLSKAHEIAFIVCLSKQTDY
jgi:hypothetical protein